jgi:carbon starvation protein
VIAVWVTRSGRNPTAVLVPLVFLLIMTSWALIKNLQNFVEAEEWVLAPLDAIIFVLAIWLIVEAALSLRTAFRERPAGAMVDRSGGEPVVSQTNREDEQR